MALNVKLIVKRDIVIAKIRGELDEYSCVDLKTKLLEVIGKYDINNVLINMQEITFMDSTGIGLMLSIYNKIKFQGKLYLSNIHRDIEKVVLLTGLYKICEVVSSEESGLEKLGVA